MYGNGAATGMEITAVALKPIHAAPPPGLSACFAAAAGSALRSTAVFRSAASSARGTASSSTVSVWFPRVHSGNVSLVSKKEKSKRTPPLSKALCGAGPARGRVLKKTKNIYLFTCTAHAEAAEKEEINWFLLRASLNCH